MLGIRGSSIRTRLTTLSLLVSSAALLLACSAFLVYEIITYPQAMVRNLQTHAQIISANATASILFQDPESAGQTLAALRADPHIEFVAIETPDGRTFARYLRQGLREPPPRQPMQDGAVHFEENRVLLRHPIVSEGNVVARLYVQSDLQERSSRVRRYLLITGIILCVSLIGGLAIATRLQRNISEPILQLVNAARTVTEKNSYSVRVPTEGEGEIGLLARTFNHMLEQIERQDAELRLAVRARDEFLSVASHELKTPLTPLQLQVQKLQVMAGRQSGASLDRVVSGLEVADRQVGRLTKLVDNLLDISRITSHRMKLEYETFDLAGLVREVTARFAQELARAGCALTVHAETPVVGTWDRTRVDQVISNFLSNAIKYGAGKPVEVIVDLHQNGAASRARVRVRDQGIGIAPADHPRIFERFERAVSEHNYAGLGLGLWIVRQIVDALGGEVKVDSRPGAGATFTVELPVEPPPSARVRITPASGSSVN